jgi:hypothetical protein
MCSAYNIPLPEGEVLNNQAENLPNNFNHNQDCVDQLDECSVLGCHQFSFKKTIKCESPLCFELPCESVVSRR